MKSLAWALLSALADVCSKDDGRTGLLCLVVYVVIMLVMSAFILNADI